MSRSRFEEILQALHFSENTKDDKSDKGYKLRSLINHVNQRFSECNPDDCTQSIDEHIVKYTGWSSMKQYLKNKPFTWGFKFWFRCASKTGYLYRLDLYLGKKEKREENHGPSVALKMTELWVNFSAILFYEAQHVVKIFTAGYCLFAMRSLISSLSLKISC